MKNKVVADKVETIKVITHSIPGINIPNTFKRLRLVNVLLLKLCKKVDYSQFLRILKFLISSLLLLLFLRK